MTSDELLELKTKFAMYSKGCSDAAHKNRLKNESGVLARLDICFCWRIFWILSEKKEV